MIPIEPGWVALLVFSPGLIILILLIYIAHFYVERIESLLEKSSYIQGIRSTFLRAGLPGKVLRTCCIACVMTMPAIYARRGLINMKEVNNFPLKMKRTLIGLWLALTIEILSMLVFRAWLYLR